MRQFFVSDVLHVGDETVFDVRQSHHIADVLRMKNGDTVRLADVSGNVFLASLRFEGTTVKADVNEQCDTLPEGKITVAAAMIKKEKWELMIQKACELGASVIVPLVTSRTIIHLDDKEINKKLDRWNKIALQACQQCNRSSLCVVERPIPLSQIEKYRREVNLAAYENEETVKLRETLNSDEITFVVGPEGGLEEEECSLLMDAGFKAVILKTNILRCETASIYAIGAVQTILESTCR